MSAQRFDRAHRNVAVLVLAQSVLGAQMPMVFIMAGLSGAMLADNPCLATLPITCVVLGSMLAASPLSMLMQRFGRRAGFLLGAAAGALGGATAATGLSLGSFPVFLLGSFLTGIYMSAHGFYRFAAADSASDAFRPRAISFVMAGGLAAALLGPQIVKQTSEMFGHPFLGAYLGIIGLNLFGAVIFLALDLPPPEAPGAAAPRGRSRRQLLASPRIAVAIICATVSYALMNLVMTASPLAIVGCGFSSNNAADIVSAHVLAMYAPAFFTGHLINRFGAERIVALGLLILLGAGAAGLAGVTLTHFTTALLLLGLGWNFGFIGATAMLTAAHDPAERGRVQGLNDMIMFGGVLVASLASGGLMNCAGSDPVAGWSAVNLAMGPFLMLAFGALIWLLMREARRPA